LFVAVWPPGEVVRQLQALPRPSVPKVRYTTEEQWHVTLAFLGEVADPEPVLAAVQAAASAVPAPVDVAMGPAVELLGRQVLCLPVEGLDEVAAAVRRETAAWIRSEDGRPFKGHLTVARGMGRSVVPRRAAGTHFSARWHAASVSLVASELHSDGARYSDMGVGWLGGGPGQDA
jgi:2'-5' RNA ligase